MKRIVRVITIATLTSNALLLGVSPDARADSPELKPSTGVADRTFQGPPVKVDIESVRAGQFIDMFLRWGHDQAINTQIDRALADAFPRVIKELSRSAPGSGYLIDIPIYAHSEGQKVFQGPVELGVGQSPADAYAHSQKTGGLRSAPPAGLLLDSEASFMVWCSLESGTLTYRRAWRDFVRAEGERKLEAEQKAKAEAEQKARAEAAQKQAAAFAQMEAMRLAEAQRQAEMARQLQQQAADEAIRREAALAIDRQAAQQAQEAAAQMARVRAEQGAAMQAAELARQAQAQAELNAWAKRQSDESARQQAEQAARMQKEALERLGQPSVFVLTAPSPSPPYVFP